MSRSCGPDCQPDRGLHSIVQWGRWSDLNTIRRRNLFQFLYEPANLPDDRGSCVNGRGRFMIVSVDAPPADFDEKPVDDVYIYPYSVLVQLLDPTRL